MDISRCSLKKQCERLGLPIAQWSRSKTKTPELAVVEAMTSAARKVAWCEGGSIQLLLYCLSFERLREFYKAWAAKELKELAASGAVVQTDPDVYAQSYMYSIRFGLESTRLLEFPHLPTHMVDAIGRASEADLVRAFDTLLSWQRKAPGFTDRLPAGRWRHKKWVGVNRDLIVALYRAFGPARCADIARGLLADTIGQQSGWPDLTWVEGTNVELVEVKTTDRLHPSQIATIPKLQKVLQVPIQVIQLK